jgi:hypothetical protein
VKVKWQSDDLLGLDYLELELKPGVRHFQRSKWRGSKGRMDKAIVPNIHVSDTGYPVYIRKTNISC